MKTTSDYLSIINYGEEFLYGGRFYIKAKDEGIVDIWNGDILYPPYNLPINRLQDNTLAQRIAWVKALIQRKAPLNSVRAGEWFIYQDEVCILTQDYAIVNLLSGDVIGYNKVIDTTEEVSVLIRR